MKSKFSSKLFMLALALPAIANAQTSAEWRSAVASAAPVATPASGDWNTPANWQKYDGTAMAWVAATSKPGLSNSAMLTVLTGSAMTLSGSSGSLNTTVQTGGSIKWGSGTAAQGLRMSGTSLVNNGTIGGNAATADDSINIELSGTAHQWTLSGTGTTIVNRLRILGGTGTTTGNQINGIISAPVTFNNQSNSFGSAVGLTAYYGSTSANTDVDSITISAGAVVTFTRGAVLHYQSVTNTNAGGSYVYNINGTADLSASVGTTYISPIATNASSVVTLNVSGVLKTGAVFSTMDSSLYNGTPATPTPGSVALNVLAGGVVDATPTDFKMDNAIAAAFNMVTTAIMKRFISTPGTYAKYPVATAAHGNNTVSIQNAGTADTFSVSITNTFDFVNPPTDLTKVVGREWTIKETGTGGKMDSLKFTWLAAEQGSAVGTTPSVYVRPASGATQVEYVSGTNVTVSGSGTVASPYLAVVGVPAGAPAGKYFIGVAGLPTAVASVANASDLNVTVAPNPTTNKQISYQISGSQAGTYHVAVYNVLGQAVHNSDVTYNANTTNYKINMENAPTGIYQVEISNATTKIGKRVVVE